MTAINSLKTLGTAGFLVGYGVAAFKSQQKWYDLIAGDSYDRTCPAPGRLSRLASRVGQAVALILSPCASTLMPLAPVIIPAQTLLPLLDLKKIFDVIEKMFAGFRLNLKKETQLAIGIAALSALCVKILYKSYQEGTSKKTSLKERAVEAIGAGSTFILTSTLSLPLGLLSLFVLGRIGWQERYIQKKAEYCLKSALDGYRSHFRGRPQQELLAVRQKLESIQTTHLQIYQHLNGLLPSANRQEDIERNSETFSKTEEVHISCVGDMLSILETCSTEELNNLERLAQKQASVGECLILVEELKDKKRSLKKLADVNALLANQAFQDAIKEFKDLQVVSSLQAMKLILEQNRDLDWNQGRKLDFLKEGKEAFAEKEKDVGLWNCFLGACSDAKKQDSYSWKSEWRSSQESHHSKSRRNNKIKEMDLFLDEKLPLVKDRIGAEVESYITKCLTDYKSNLTNGKNLKSDEETRLAFFKAGISLVRANRLQDLIQEFIGLCNSESELPAVSAFLDKQKSAKEKDEVVQEYERRHYQMTWKIPERGTFVELIGKEQRLFLDSYLSLIKKGKEIPEDQQLRYRFLSTGWNIFQKLVFDKKVWEEFKDFSTHQNSDKYEEFIKTHSS